MEGFYKEENGEWFYAPNFVINQSYELFIELKDTYTYPIDGWNYYDEAPQEYINYIENYES